MGQSWEKHFPHSERRGAAAENQPHITLEFGLCVNQIHRALLTKKPQFGIIRPRGFP